MDWASSKLESDVAPVLCFLSRTGRALREIIFFSPRGEVLLKSLHKTIDRPSETMKGPTVLNFTTQIIEKGSHLLTDAHRSFLDLVNKGYSLDARKLDLGKDPNHLKWIHTTISNLKAFVLGTFHGLDSRHLQTYLDEFCYRFNRRNFIGQLFNRVIKSCVSTCTITYNELRA